MIKQYKIEAPLTIHERVDQFRKQHQKDMDQILKFPRDGSLKPVSKIKYLGLQVHPAGRKDNFPE